MCLTAKTGGFDPPDVGSIPASPSNNGTVAKLANALRLDRSGRKVLRVRLPSVLPILLNNRYETI